MGVGVGETDEGVSEGVGDSEEDGSTVDDGATDVSVVDGTTVVSGTTVVVAVGAGSEEILPSSVMFSLAQSLDGHRH